MLASPDFTLSFCPTSNVDNACLAPRVRNMDSFQLKTLSGGVSVGIHPSKKRILRAQFRNQSGSPATRATDSTKRSSYGGCIPAVLQALESIHDLDEALRPWESILNSKERTIILKEQTDWRRAVEIFEWFKSKTCYEVHVIHYNIMLRILGKARKWDLMVTLWGEMRSKQILPTNSTYGTLIDAFSKGGRIRESLIWLAEMCKQGMKPDEVTMGIVVQTYKRAGEFLKAEEFFMRWSSSVGEASQMHKAYGLHTYNTLIDTYGKAGQLEGASETFAQMLREGIFPDRVTFNTMIHVCGNHGHLDEVASLLTMMEELQIYPDTRTYNILISLYVKNDNMIEATRCLSNMKTAGLVPDLVSYRTLLYAFSIRNMVSDAQSLVSEMENRGLEIDEYTQSALTRMYIHAGMLEQSWSWFQKFQSQMSSECFSANIDAYGENGNIILAEKGFFCCLERKKLSVLVVNVMIKAYGKEGDYDKACEVFDRMESFGVVPDKCSYSSLVQILTSANLPHKALSYVRRMQVAGLVTDCIPYSMVMANLVKYGDLKLMDDLFKEMVSFGLQPDIVVFSILINAAAEIGNVQQAVYHFHTMVSSGFTANTIICNSMIKVYTKAGYLQEACEMYELAKTLANGPDVYSSNCLINLYCENVMVTEAMEIFKHLKGRKEANEFSYAMMLCLYKKVGRHYDASNICQEMFVLGLVTSTLSYNAVIGLHASRGRLMEIIDSLHHMLNTGVKPNDSTFKLLGDILLKHGVSKRTINCLESARKEDDQIGLNQWLRAISSISKLGGKKMNLDGKKEAHFQVNTARMYAPVGEQVSIEELMTTRQCSYG